MMQMLRRQAIGWLELTTTPPATQQSVPQVEACRTFAIGIYLTPVWLQTYRGCCRERIVPRRLFAATHDREPRAIRGLRLQPHRRGSSHRLYRCLRAAANDFLIAAPLLCESDPLQ